MPTTPTHSSSPSAPCCGQPTSKFRKRWRTGGRRSTSPGRGALRRRPRNFPRGRRGGTPLPAHSPEDTACSTARPDLKTKPDSLTVTATQPIYTGGRTVAQTSQAINLVESPRGQTLAAETTGVQAVAQAHLAVGRHQALLEVNRNNVAVLRKQLEATQDRFRVGEVTRTDVAQAEASLAQAVGQLVTAQGNPEKSGAEYAPAAGTRPGR